LCFDHAIPELHSSGLDGDPIVALMGEHSCGRTILDVRGAIERLRGGVPACDHRLGGGSQGGRCPGRRGLRLGNCGRSLLIGIGLRCAGKRGRIDYNTLRNA
jgi:hypothetical protein